MVNIRLCRKSAPVLFRWEIKTGERPEVQGSGLQDLVTQIVKLLNVGRGWTLASKVGGKVVFNGEVYRQEETAVARLAGSLLVAKTFGPDDRTRAVGLTQVANEVVAASGEEFDLRLTIVQIPE